MADYKFKAFLLQTIINGPSPKKTLEERAKTADTIFVLNTRLGKDLWKAWTTVSSFFLSNNAAALAYKQNIMLDEHEPSKPIADLIPCSNKNYFSYQVWETNMYLQISVLNTLVEPAVFIHN